MNKLQVHVKEIDLEQTGRWSEAKANEWYERQGWLVGCNYIPSTAINQLEMWQPETFDLPRIEKELGWAKGLGFNNIRVFLHHLLWEQDPTGFLQRLDMFLSVADRHDIGTMFVLFDAVWDPYPKIGAQPQPKFGVHNSGWVQSPGADVLKKADSYDQLQSYVQGVIGRFANDERVVIWDLFNEPDNMNITSYNDVDYGEQKAELSLKLLKKTILWAREMNPVQPLTAAPWNWMEGEGNTLSDLDNYMFNHSDVISFHCYENQSGMEQRIKSLKRFNRPMLCTEYMARPQGSTFESVLPLLKKYNVGAYNWGFVAGKTQTHFPWDSWASAYQKEPEVWFHDIFHSNGLPFDHKEIELIRKLTKRENPSYKKVA